MIEITNIIIPTFITTGISGILGFLISIIANKFKVEINEHQQKITNMLPGYNCGACGKAGCFNLAEEILKNKESVNKCKPIKKEQKQLIVNYINFIKK